MNCKFIWIFRDSGMVVSLLCSGSSLAWRPLPPCGYCLEAGMTGRVWCIVFTLAFDSSPLMGEGDMGGVVLFTRVTLSPCGYCLKASMTGRSTALVDCGLDPQ